MFENIVECNEVLDKDHKPVVQHIDTLEHRLVVVVAKDNK